jgi:hypothetical protein
VYQLRQRRALLPADPIEWRTSEIRKAGKLLDVDKITSQRGGLQSFGLGSATWPNSRGGADAQPSA